VTRTIEVDAFTEPDVPVTVTVDVPVVAKMLAVSVSKLLPVVGLGLKDAVTPPGRPDADKLTFPVKSPNAVTVTVFVLGEPGEICIMPDEARRLKPGGSMVRARTVVAVIAPEVPVMVSE
jgi:hypothetical protein